MIQIIVVDDELLSRAGIQSLFDGVGNIIVAGSFGTAEEALSYLEHYPVDVVLTDIEMSDMDGLDFAQRVKERHYASAVIIISSHDNFDYAKEAISIGVDGYMLKHEINQKMLVDEIEHVITRTAPLVNVLRPVPELKHEPLVGIRRLVVLHFLSQDDQNSSMLGHLLEGVISAFHQAELTLPLGKDPYVVFAFPSHKPKEERQTQLMQILQTIGERLQEYTNHACIFGVSPWFADDADISLHIKQATIATQFYFYHPGNQVFLSTQPRTPFPTVIFSSNRFLLDDGMFVFFTQLSVFLSSAEQCAMEPKLVKEQLVRSIGIFLFQIKQQCCLENASWSKWNIEQVCLASISIAENTKDLQQNLYNNLSKFRDSLIGVKSQDNISFVIEAINQNPAQKFSLEKLARIGCTSIPSLCRKFRERCGMTVVSYIQKKRIEMVRNLLMNQDLSLDVIAEKTGFSNTNYLSRVFKNVQGETITAYLRHKEKKPMK